MASCSSACPASLPNQQRARPDQDILRGHRCLPCTAATSPQASEPAVRYPATGGSFARSGNGSSPAEPDCRLAAVFAVGIPGAPEGGESGGERFADATGSRRSDVRMVSVPPPARAPIGPPHRGYPADSHERGSQLWPDTTGKAPKRMTTTQRHYSRNRVRSHGRKAARTPGRRLVRH